MAAAIKATRFNFAIVFFVALGSFTYGFNASIMGTVFGLESFFNYFKLEQTGAGAAHTNNIIGGMYCVSVWRFVLCGIPANITATNGLFSAGGIIGCAILPFLADRIGRKHTIQIVCGVCIISAILQAASVHIAMLLVGRFINGIA